MAKSILRADGQKFVFQINRLSCIQFLVHLPENQRSARELLELTILKLRGFVWKRRIDSNFWLCHEIRRAITRHPLE